MNKTCKGERIVYSSSNIDTSSKGNDATDIIITINKHDKFSVWKKVDNKYKKILEDCLYLQDAIDFAQEL